MLNLPTGELAENGCAVLREVVPPPILAAFEAEMDRLARFHLARRGAESRGADAMVDLLRDGREFRRVIFPQLKTLPSVHALGEAVRVHVLGAPFWSDLGIEIPAVHWLLKADVPGENKYLLPMHQDYNTPAHRAWRIWLPLRPANEQNGTMRFVPGSHWAGHIQHDTSNPERPEVRADDYDPARVQMLRLDAGNAFLFHPLLVHGSVPATGDRMKYALIVNFWDALSYADPDDPDDPIPARMAMGAERDKVRGDRDPIKMAVEG